MEKNKNSGARTGCLIVAIVVLLLLGAVELKTGVGRFVGYIAYESIKERLHRIPFNSADWKNPALVRSKDPIRIRMVDDLLKHYNLVGMTKAEINNLLGKPDHSYTPGSIHYYLGPERGWICVDAELLEITFDKLGRVKSAKIITS